MSRLETYLDSSYLRAANVLNGKKARRKIIAYVESYDDVFFWRSILSQAETPEVCFQVMLPSRSRKLERGKKAALMSAFKNNVGPDMIACVDADFDFLKQGSNQLSDVVCNNPFVFHTYAYAIENLQCWAPSLHDACVMATLNDSAEIMNFEAFFYEYSRIIYPLFLWCVLFARNPSYGDFTIPDFMVIIKTGTIVRNHVEETLRRVADKVKRKLRFLDATMPGRIKKIYAGLDEELQRIGIKPEETYLYIQGHSLFKDTVVPMLTRICDYLVNKQENDIRNESKHSTQRDNEISCYKHSVEDITSMLKKNTAYLRSPQVARILNDISEYMQSHLNTQVNLQQ